MALSPTEIASLLADRPGKKQAVAGIAGAGNAWIKVYTEPRTDYMADNPYKLELADVAQSLMGKFHNKAGTMTRSAKGRSRMLPNGSVKYINPGMGGEVEVVAYDATKVVK